MTSIFSHVARSLIALHIWHYIEAEPHALSKNNLTILVNQLSELIIISNWLNTNGLYISLSAFARIS